MSKKSTVKFPSIAAVAAELRAINGEFGADLSRAGDDDNYMDVRLQVYPDGQWAIRVGSSDYDQDHHGFWGASSLDGRRFNSEGVARDLIDQARDHQAQSE